MDAAEVTRLLKACPHEQIPVEEKDRLVYVIHISNWPSTRWLFVGPESPLLEELRRWQEEWNAEHPDWRGWAG